MIIHVLVCLYIATHSLDAVYGRIIDHEEPTTIITTNQSINFEFVHDHFFDDNTDSYLLINTTSSHNFVVSMQNVDCVGCELNDVAQVSSYHDATVRLSTSYPYYYILVRDYENDETICSKYHKIPFYFGENATYLLSIVYDQEDGSENESCNIHVLNSPADKYLPLIIGIIILVCCGLLFIAYKYFFRKFNRSTRYDSIATLADVNNMVNDVNVTDSTNFSRKIKRLHSIDAFRGLCICVMIFVNYGSGNYAIIDHSIWNGLHVADLVFPCFIVIMGVSIALSTNTHVNQVAELSSNLNKTRKILFLRILKRTGLLFFFGLLTSNNYTIKTQEIRIMGVLQRFAVSYFVCATLELLYLKVHDPVYTEAMHLNYSTSKLNSFKLHFMEIFFYPCQWIVMGIFTVVWALVTLLLPVKGCPYGYLGPGGLHNNGSYQNCTGGAAGLIDRLILGESHVYQWSTCRLMYKTTLPYDPEGLLGCLNSCVLTYIGVSAGHIMIQYKEAVKRISRFAAYSVMYGVLALILCKGSRDDGWIPINKNLWSLSFIMAIASIAFLIMITLYLLIDVWHIFSGKPFVYPGRNSICIYICHIVFGSFFPIQFYVPFTHSYLLALHVYGVVLWCLVAALLYRKNIFISL